MGPFCPPVALSGMGLWGRQKLGDSTRFRAKPGAPGSQVHTLKVSYPHVGVQR